MIIDLDSWEAGYDDGLLGRPSQCTPGFDWLSYSTGYCQARACRAGTKEARVPPYTRHQPSEPINGSVTGLG